jgi:hypothetical protein
MDSYMVVIVALTCPNFGEREKSQESEEEME